MLAYENRMPDVTLPKLEHPERQTSTQITNLNAPEHEAFYSICIMAFLK